MNQGFSEDEVIIERRGRLGLITLNRPKALNALSLEMIRQISSALHRWRSDDAVQSVFFRGAGERAFCAGGDIKAFHRAGMDFRRGAVTRRVPAAFFAEEYSLNKQIYHYKKPVIGFMNGITMGGGFGVAGNAKYRIATDKTTFAMPEGNIGFFPDVGSVYHLLRAPHNIGLYLALTGISVPAGDMMYAGQAEYYIPIAKEEDLIAALEAQDAESVLNAMKEKKPPPESLEIFREKIEPIFALMSVKEICKALERDGSDWASKTLRTIKKRSPTSVMVTAAHFWKARGKDFDAVMRTDFILAQRFLERMDMYEGIRAVLIDKDNMPDWQPPAVSDLTEDDVQRYFEPTGYDLDDVQIFAA